MALLVLLGSCATRGPGDEAEIEGIRREHAASMTAFKEQQRRVLSSEQGPDSLNFGQLGEVIVRRVELVGWPGSASLRADFMWVNTYGRTRRAPSVQLSIIDERGEPWRSGTLELSTTFSIEYGRGSTYSGWLHVPTDGIELRPGWTWAIELQS